MKKYLIFILVCWCCNCIGQVELVPNGNFAKGGTNACASCVMYEPQVDVWQPADGFPDSWPVPTACLSSFPPPPSYISPHIIGLSDYTAIQVWLNSPLHGKLGGHKIYKFQCDAAYQRITGSTSTLSPQFTFHVANKGASYDPSSTQLGNGGTIAGSPNPCNVPDHCPWWNYNATYCSYSSSFHEIKNTFNMTQAAGVWQHYEYTFSVPDSWDGQLQTLIIESHHDNSQNIFYGDYDFIANASLTEEDYCSCTYSTGQPYLVSGFGTGTGSGSVGYPEGIVNLGLVIGNNPVYMVEFGNAVQANFYVFSRTSQIMYSYSMFEASGLVDPGYPNKALYWDGIDYNGNPLPVDVYPVELVLYNPCWSGGTNMDSIICEGNATILGGSPPALQWYTTTNYNLSNCCQPDEYYQNVNYTSNLSTSTTNYITAGSNVTTGATGNVIVEPGVSVDYYSEKINLKPGFSAKTGSNFKGDIAQCQNTFSPIRDTGKITERPKPLIINDNNAIPAVDVFPNPSNGKFKIAFEGISNTSKEIKVSITDMVGDLVYVSTYANQNSAEIDFSSKPKGVYIISVVINNVTYQKKLILI